MYVSKKAPSVEDTVAEAPAMQFRAHDCGWLGLSPELEGEGFAYWAGAGLGCGATADCGAAVCERVLVGREDCGWERLEGLANGVGDTSDSGV